MTASPDTQPLSVLVVEDHALTRLGIRSVVNDAEGVTIAGEAGNAAEGFEKFRSLRPDVTILGLRFPDSCSIDDLDNYFVDTPRARLIVLADHAGDAEIKRALTKGALGFICKDAEPAELISAIRAVGAGRKYIPADIAGILSEHIGSEDLTATESNVLRMIVGGMSNKEIAFTLDVTENTVKTHVKNIFGKLGVSDRTTAATTAIKRGLIRVDL